ncbi:nucleotidyltransferase substrate binding protein [Nitrosomonas communis]|uniref:Nucleotidyltransferase substrate binding protein, HI0074 family n=1 Tax=Nitrosomonas communis TaxID=44574 RepID=A0A1I4JJ41_9PROT|nr:nucleotidyltransferase substrate binding protein [Nitrosomonas communis]SFL66608.1 nucleotidyltransferase substrate binding protein, HI0074 family [Nitrosomonas communis]
MSLNVDPFLRTIATLEQALIALQRLENDDILYDLYRNAAIKSLELSLEAIGKLLRKTLKSYSGNPRAVDGLMFNDVLRMAGRHGLLDMDGVERWLAYRANRNTVAHDYGEGFTNQTLKLLPQFINDARELADTLKHLPNEQAD